MRQTNPARVGVITALALLVHLVVGAIGVPVVAQGSEPPSAACDWYGSVTYTENKVYDLPDAGSKQLDFTQWSADSGPVPGQDCAFPALSGKSDMDYVKVGERPCPFPYYDPPFTSVVTTTWKQRISGSVTGRYDFVATPGSSGDLEVNLFVNADAPFEGTFEAMDEGGCENSTTTYPPEYRSWTPGAQFGPCQSAASDPVTALVVPASTQAVRGSCTRQFTDGGFTYTEIKKFNFRRTVCDPAVDTDSGGVSDCQEFERGTDPLLASDDGGSDSDGDGVPDSTDLCPGTPSGTAVDATGCAAPDSDGDGVRDSVDLCANTPAGSTVDAFGCTTVITDTDGDGVLDASDECVTVPGQGSASGCPDSDGDGLEDRVDRCPTDSGPSDLAGCPDRDGDGVPDVDDNCAETANPNQADADGDGIGDACDNQAPVARDDAATTVAGQAVTINVLANDDDPDGDPLTVVSCSQPTGGLVTTAASSVVLQPASGFAGDLTFDCTISDPYGATATANVTVTVLGQLTVTITATYTTFWQDYVPNGLKFLRKPAADRVVVRGTTSVVVTGASNPGLAIQAICIDPSWTAVANSNAGTYPISWYDGGADLNNSDHPFWDTLAQSTTGFDSTITAKAPACSSPGQSQMTWGPSGSLDAQTTQLSGQRADLVSLSHSARVTILMSNGALYTFTGSHIEKAPKKVPTSKALDFTVTRTIGG